MKRYHWTLLACVLIAACGDDSSDGDDGNTAEKTDAAVRQDASIDAGTTPPSSDAGARDAATLPDARAADASLSGDGGVHLAQVYDDIFGNAGSCWICHPLVNGNVDFSSADTAYETLVTNPLVQCSGKPLVTPGDPSKSYLVDLVTLDKPCASKPDVPRMPTLGPLSTEQIAQIKQWISDGAKK